MRMTCYPRSLQQTKSQHAHQVRRRVVERIACEIEGYNIVVMQHPRKVFDGLLSELCRLLWGQWIDLFDHRTCGVGFELLSQRLLHDRPFFYLLVCNADL